MRRDHKPTPFAVLSLQSEAIRFQMRKYRLRQQSHTFAECANVWGTRRLRNMLANPGVALTWWDQDVWAQRLGYAQQDASLSAAVFRALRESNLRLLESVPRARWVECYGVHEVRGRQTVEEFVRLEAAHDLNHLRQIDRILGRCMQW